MGQGFEKFAKWGVAGAVAIITIAFVVSYWRNMPSEDDQPINQDVEELLQRRQQSEP
jgi:hypothetical protein